MNYLSHYVYNHEILALAPQPYFVMGVALPDLWSRYTRARRIRWKSVQAFHPADETDRTLRAGLLNHVEVDRRFHCLPAFLRMQRLLKDQLAHAQLRSGLLDFFAHIGIELALDHVLLRRRPGLADRFYDDLARCERGEVQSRVARLGTVDTTGLGDVIGAFVTRRFLRWYTQPEGLMEATRLILSRTSVAVTADGRFLAELFERAIPLADPDAVWRELPGPDPNPTYAG
ncbi:MAG: hypothetical protein HRF50_12570 [Phycisphaerae bacterium]|jgi:hypothetical protein